MSESSCIISFFFFSQAVDQLIAKDKELQAAIKQVQEQQARQHEIQTVKEEISKKDQEILSLESQLKEAEKLLVSDYKSHCDNLSLEMG